MRAIEEMAAEETTAKDTPVLGTVPFSAITARFAKIRTALIGIWPLAMIVLGLLATIGWIAWLGWLLLELVAAVW